MSSCGSTLLNVAAGGAGSGTAISSVSSNTSASGSGSAGLISASGVAASRLASIASMSSWLLLAAGSGAGGGGGGAGFGAGTGFGAGAIADGGISFITAGFAAATGLAGFSPAAGFASSSAMMRRIDARISSIEGSWTFAGCVISDSTSKPSYLHQATKESPVPNLHAGIFIAPARLVPRSGPPDAPRRPPPPRGNPTQGRERQQRGPRIAQLTPPTVRHGYK